MGSGASTKKPESLVQKKLNAANAFSDAGKRNREKREGVLNGGAEDGRPKAGTLILNPDTSEKSDRGSEKQNGGPVTTSEQNGNNNQNGDAKTDMDDDVFEADENVKEKILRIQSVFRGYQDRKSLQKQNDMAIKIQRQFRRHRSSLASNEGEKAEVESVASVARASGGQTSLGSTPLPDSEESKPKRLTKEEQLKLLGERKALRRERARAWRDTQGSKKELKMEIGEQTKQNFTNFQDEITELQWLAEQQMEITVCGGREFVGPRVLLISSKVPKADVLVQAAKGENVLIFNYDFETDSFDSLLDAIRVNLQAYKPGCKAQSLCIYAQGGPGYLYVLKKRVLTTAKLKKESEADQVRFWKDVGRQMSRIHPEDTVIHVMGCNMLGSESGLDLFDQLEEIIQPNIVRFESPLELSAEGVQMISMYFDPVKYKMWKSTKFSKTDLKLPPSMR